MSNHEVVYFTVGEFRATTEVMADVEAGHYKIGANPLSRMYYKKLAGHLKRGNQIRLDAIEAFEEVPGFRLLNTPGIQLAPRVRKFLETAIGEAVMRYENEPPTETSDIESIHEKINVLRGLANTLASQKH